ncbi:MAG: pilus assembly protein PilM [Myxococcales bacterium]|nr:MAG: pilus assembly protein PilM [Myxococcales bacterium]
MARVIGIDIDAHSIKAVLLRSSLRSHELLAYDEIVLDKDLVSDELKRKAIYEGLRELQQRFSSETDSVVCAISGGIVSMRTLNFPKVALRHLDGLVPNELEAELPFDIEEVVFDYQSVAKGDESLQVLATAVPKSALEDTIELFSSAGLSPREIAIGAASLDGLAPLLADLRAPGPIVLVDFRNAETDVCIIQNGHCVLARTLSHGVRSSQSSPETLAMQIKQTLASYRASNGLLPVQAYIVGEGSTLPNASRWVSELLHIPTDTLLLPVASGLEAEQTTRYARAAALAARILGRGKRINLRSGEFRPERATSVLRERAGLLAACAVAIVVSFVVFAYGHLQLLENQNEALKIELSQLSKKVFDDEASDPKRARELLEGRGQGKNPLPEIRAFDIMEFVSNAVPPNIAHDTRQLRIELGIGGGRGRLELEEF